MVKNKRNNKSRDVIHQLMDYVSTFLHNFGYKLNLPNSLVVLFIIVVFIVVVVIICSGTWSKISPVRSVIAVCSTDPKFIGTLWCTIFGIV